MSEHTPSQAEGEPDPTTTGADAEPDRADRRDTPRTTPSQAEGDDEEGDRDDAAEWEAGWSGP
jgi:hypothetical protein